MDKQELCRQSYEIINNKAQSNSFIQGLSGLGGFPWTLLADGVTLFTHYLDMINSIRRLYGRREVSEKEISAVLGGLSSEIMVDIMADKLAGNIPIIGIYFNAICAKTMTWRIGILMTMLSARGESVDDVAIKDSMIVIRNIFPQVDMFKFAQPDYATFKKMVVSVADDTIEEYNRKIKKAMDAFE